MVCALVHIPAMTTKPELIPLSTALRQRLESIDAELLEITRKREQLATLRQSIQQTLEQEEALAGAVHPDDEAARQTGDGPHISVRLLRALQSGPKTLEQLKGTPSLQIALDKHPTPGRAINFALVGLQKGGHVERLENGAWKLVPGATRG